MVNPVDLPKIIIIQQFSKKHLGVDIRDYDYDNQKLLSHRAMERSKVLSIGLGKRFGEPYIELEGLNTGILYVYCHNTSVVMIDDVIEEGIIIGKPSLVGTWGDKQNKKKFHLHLGLKRDGKYIDPIEFFQEYGLEYT